MFLVYDEKMEKGMLGDEVGRVPGLLCKGT